MFEDSIGRLFGFDETILWKEYNLSPNPADSISFDNRFLECSIAVGKIYRGKERISIIHGLWTYHLDTYTSRNSAQG